MATTDVLRSRRARWLVPVAALGVIVGGVAVNTAVANADPTLPARSAAQLLASLAQAPSQSFSGTVQEDADLGIPALPGAASTSLSWQSLITGSHTARVWHATPTKSRVSLVGDLAESDVVRNGRDVWVWSSRENTVQHVVLPDAVSVRPDATPPLDPQAAAEQALAAIDPTTSVTVDSTSRVAGRAVYELVLAPRSSQSLIGQVRLAVDSETFLPLAVQVIARGSTDPAFETAFTSISFDTPADSVFAFTPPAGAQVSESSPQGLGTPKEHASGDTTGAARPKVIGEGWTAVVEIPDAGGILDGAQSQQGSGGSTASALLRATTTVTGGFGTGQLLQTALVSALLLPDGRMFVGAVTPDLLEQVAGTSPR
jgi:outer membrane lipoprotein-sorting protein